MSDQPELFYFRADGGLVFPFKRMNINFTIFKRDNSKYLHFRANE